MLLKSGWLERQFKKIEEDVLTWPDWMLREAGMTEIIQKKKRLLKRKGCCENSHC